MCGGGYVYMATIDMNRHINTRTPGTDARNTRSPPDPSAAAHLRPPSFAGTCAAGPPGADAAFLRAPCGEHSSLPGTLQNRAVIVINASNTAKMKGGKAQWVSVKCE